ncbi:MAG TPA: sulfotransferase family 2 domain-containing protein [Bacillus sp. (in: firmicutes)]|uniref:sulfotransferase family 2 domain-containing protein n=1 Tax=Bacillus litorisediminis TaxID=2922713 RepID=UPI001FAB8E2B|nr:sulfotransferase family 2 domain-containing protein [Bacillus litorisediminis]HWO75370.1 sulfotransferase family 2 domain-containing protein [Bacillus sp. (in: firmicutes)]
MTQSDEILIYLHLPKTGGTTFLSILEGNYSLDERIPVYTEPNINHFQYVEAKIQENTKCIYGHTLFGIHEALSLPATYMTFLRDPVERVISEYYFNFYKPHVLNKKSLVFKNLEEFVSHKDFCNLQSKYLFGRNSLPKNAFDRIKQNIDQYFSVIGITELFDESVFLLKKQFGWNKIEYTRKNVTASRPKKEYLQKSLLEKIIENNQLDLAVYHYAKYLLLTKLEELDEYHKIELHDYKSKINELNSNNDSN